MWAQLRKLYGQQPYPVLNLPEWRFPLRYHLLAVSLSMRDLRWFGDDLHTVSGRILLEQHRLRGLSQQLPHLHLLWLYPLQPGLHLCYRLHSVHRVCSTLCQLLCQRHYNMYRLRDQHWPLVDERGVPILFRCQLPFLLGQYLFHL